MNLINVSIQIVWCVKWFTARVTFVICRAVFLIIFWDFGMYWGTKLDVDSWTVWNLRIWISKYSDTENVLLHKSHKMFWPSWCILIWFEKYFTSKPTFGIFNFYCDFFGRRKNFFIVFMNCHSSAVKIVVRNQIFKFFVTNVTL